MIDFVDGLAVVITALERAEVPYVVVGTMAAARWGVARTAREIELVLVRNPLTVDDVLAALDHDDLHVSVHTARTALADGGSFSVIHTPSGAKFDLCAASPDDEFERSRLDRRMRAEVLGVEFGVATAEDVVLAKLRRRRESRSEVPWRDCVELAAVNELDVAYLRRWAPILGVTDDVAGVLGDDPPIAT